MRPMYDPRVHLPGSPVRKGLEPGIDPIDVVVSWVSLSTIIHEPFSRR